MRVGTKPVIFLVAIATAVGFGSKQPRQTSWLTVAFAPPAAAADAGDLFAPVAAVLNHPRCMNCHPRDDRPRQGEDRHPHQQKD